MEFTLTISQKQISENFPTLDIKDAAIIDFLGRFSHGCTKKVEQGRVYYWFDYGKISDECPLLRLESEAIRKRMRALCSLQILEAHPENRGGRIFFAFGDNYAKTHRDFSEKGREEYPEVRKRSGRISRRGREEYPVLGEKGREEYPDNHSNQSNHNNQSSSEPNNAAEFLIKSTTEIPGVTMVEKVKVEAEKEKTPPNSAPPPKKENAWQAFDIDTAAALLKEDYTAAERFARDLSCSLQVAKEKLGPAIDEFVFDQKTVCNAYPNDREFRKHFFNWLPAKERATKAKNANQALNTAQKSTLNRLGSDKSLYDEPALF